MKILTVSDEEAPMFWDYYTPGKLAKYDLILSSGDLKAEYLRFLVTMARCPVLYIHGNHDSDYDQDGPDGCDCIDDKLIIYKGLRILGLGGSRRYNNSTYQYTEAQMRRRIRKLKRAVKLAGGVDIVLAHAAPLGVGDGEDIPHRGFSAFLDLIDACRPRYFLHGHVHLRYGMKIPRQRHYRDTEVINCCGYVELDCQPEERELPKNSFWQKLTARNYLNMDI